MDGGNSDSGALVNLHKGKKVMYSVKNSIGRSDGDFEDKNFSEYCTARALLANGCTEKVSKIFHFLEIFYKMSKKSIKIKKSIFSDFDHHDMLIYEEVGRLTPYGRRVLVLLGAPGVGRRTLKARLLAHDGDNFATITPCN